MATISDYFEQAQLSQAAYAAGLTNGLFGGGVQGSPSDYAQLLIYPMFNTYKNIFFNISMLSAEKSSCGTTFARPHVKRSIFVPRRGLVLAPMRHKVPSTSVPLRSLCAH